MSVHQVTQPSIFVVFQGIGVLLNIVDGKLVPVEPRKEGATADDVLNDMRGQIVDYIASKRREIKKLEAILPMVKFMAEGHAPDCGCGLSDVTKEMEEAGEYARKAITEAEAFLLDLAELMADYGLPIRAEGAEKVGAVDQASDEKIQDLLNKIRGGKLL